MKGKQKKEKAKIAIKNKNTKTVSKITKPVNNNKIAMWTKLGLAAVGLILVVLGLVFEANEIALDANIITPFKFFGLMLMTTIATIFAIGSNKNVIFKVLGIFTLTAFLASWIIPVEEYLSSVTVHGLNRLGLTDISAIAYYAIDSAQFKLVFLFSLAAFYGVLAKSEAYKNMTTAIASKLENKKLIVAISSTVLFIVLTALIQETFMVFLFIPFVITILSKMKVDKLTALVVTFGAMLVGGIAPIYGTESLINWNSTLQILMEGGIEYRLIILISALVLYTLFLFLRLKTTTLAENSEVVDPFEVEESKTNTNNMPLIIVLALTAILLLLGYIDWQGNFEITIFNDFHNWLITLGGEEKIFQNILGLSSAPMGSWHLLIGVVVINIVTLIIALLSRLKLDTIVSALESSFKLMLKPAFIVLAIYAVATTASVSLFANGITFWLYELGTSFNPNLSVISAIFTSVFYVELGLVAQVVSPYITTLYADSLGLVSVLYTSMYGFVQLFAPTSVLLLIGLFYTKVDYKAWLKYIWIFLLGIFAVIIVLQNVVAYIA